jgi:hypothetical protein
LSLAWKEKEKIMESKNDNFDLLEICLQSRFYDKLSPDKHFKKGCSMIRKFQNLIGTNLNYVLAPLLRVIFVPT